MIETIKINNMNNQLIELNKDLAESQRKLIESQKKTAFYKFHLIDTNNKLLEQIAINNQIEQAA